MGGGAEYLPFGEGGVNSDEPTIPPPVWMPPGTSTTSTRGRKRADHLMPTKETRCIGEMGKLLP